MTRAATMGTSSCATIAIAHFKGDNFKINEEYLKSKQNMKKEGLSVAEFYSQIIYPTSQPLGHTAEYPFDQLMDEIDSSSLKGKYITATLNQQQFNFENGYWVKRLEARGFKAVDKTHNDIGQDCTIFVRNNNRVEL